MITLKVNNVDKSDQVEWDSIEKQEILTKEPDSLIFRIKNYGTKTYRPILGDDITLFDGVIKIFGGILVENSEETDGFLRYFRCVCKDYTQILNRKLIAEVYDNMTAEDIIIDIVSLYAPTFTTINVVAPILVDKIVFNYVSFSEALKKLTGVLGDYDWFVDYDKDIHFFQNGMISAPFNLSDTNNTYVYNSLEVDENLHQLRNHIVVRGGDIEGALVSNTQVADGQQRVFFIGYSLALNSLVIEKALAGTPTTFVIQSVGGDGKDNPASFDCLYNPNNGLVIFPDTSKPAINDRIRSSGFPIFPLIAEKQDLGSVATYGTYQMLIVDKTIKSRDSASQLADGELIKYANPIHRAKFATYSSGLRTGQTILVQSTSRNINRDYIIERIITTLNTPTELRYTVELLASEDVTMVDILNRLAVTDVTDQIFIGENEIVDTIYSQLETINLGEVFVFSLSHNGQNETIIATEVSVAQPIDYATIFVAGAYIPTILYNGADHKRQFILNGSPLG